jgi:hypothetical protein
MERWQLYVGGTFVLAGIMSAGASLLNIDTFFEHPTAQPIVEKMGRTGARMVYFGIGLGCMAFGAVTLLL